MKNPITRAIELFDGKVTHFAEALGKHGPSATYQAVRKWERRGRPPAERVLQIEVTTHGEVTRHDLRPDLYPRAA